MARAGPTLMNMRFRGDFMLRVHGASHQAPALTSTA
jgi:hypothetical protein